MPALIRESPITQSNELAINRGGRLPDAVPGISLLSQLLTTSPPIDCSAQWAENNESIESWPYLTASSNVVLVNDLHDFTNKVSRLDGVTAVLAEEGESGERHVTTFIQTESERLSEQIIYIQADIIEDYPEKQYSFHIRVVPKDGKGDLALPSGHYFLLPWQA